MKNITVFLICLFCTLSGYTSEPLRVAMGGATHGHVGMLLDDLSRSDVILVGLWEPNKEHATKLSKEYGFDPKIIYSDLDMMLDETKPEAVAGFCSIYDHLKLVEAAAVRGIHIMVEKPLAVSMKHAKKMAALADKHGIVLMTNYETTWYPTHDRLYNMAINHAQIGSLNKVIVYDGHKGPIGIEVDSVFLDWLADPVLNGGGAVVDFGCYGANLITWLQKGEKPYRVYADVRSHQKELYPKVDDDATILVSYGDMEGVINGSWNWAFDRKDIHVYGKTGYVYADNKLDLRSRVGNEFEKEETLTELQAPYNEPFAYFKAWIRGEITPRPYDLSTLENNMIVVQILDAAKKSAKSGKAVRVK